VLSLLQRLRMEYKPKLPLILTKIESLAIEDQSGLRAPEEQLRSLFPKTFSQPLLSFKEGTKKTHAPLKVGIVLSGGQAPGGHNVISGLFDALKKLNAHSQLFGFLDGPSGIVENRHIEITEHLLAPYRNQGGFDLIGSGRTKIETDEQFQAAYKTAKELDLDGLVIVGGDDSNTNAAVLAEYFLERRVKTKVIGVPKTIDGDLKNDYIETSFGFDSASKTYSEIIGNILRDTLSAKKYYYFIKLMGRSASHLTLECALQTHPNLALISEEIEAQNKTLKDLTIQISDLITERAKQGKDYGVILIPEGIIEFIPEFKGLIRELNNLMAPDKPHVSMMEKMASKEEKAAYVSKQLSPSSLQCFESIPLEIQAQLLIDRDPHGNVQVSKIETERLFIEMVKKELKNRQKKGEYKGKFSAQPLFCGYEGRSCFPSNFDCQYCYALGYGAAVLIDAGVTGYMSCVQDLFAPPEEWQVAGVPLVSMMHLEERHGKSKPVIRKALVNLDGEAFAAFKEQRGRWRLNDEYHTPGPIQFFGPHALTEATTLTLEYETSQKAFAQANSGDLE
jgi:pyrophosphate--fructose-6-phosphate 1-phosphotransferase